LNTDDDVSHIEIVDIEYEDLEFTTDDDEQSSMTAEEILVLYLRGGSEDLEHSAYMYLLSLLDDPGQMAHLLEDCIDYDGVGEPDIADLLRCMDNLIDLGGQYTETEKRAFQKKILEAILKMEGSVKNALFSAPDDKNMLESLINSLSIDEMAQSIMEESTTDDPAIPLRRMFDELLASGESPRPKPPEERLAELEAAIQAESIERGQEEVFSNTIAPLLEEAFVEFEVSTLAGEQSELERLLDELTLSQQQMLESEVFQGIGLFAAEGEILSSASVLLEMLESETDSDGYSEISTQLEGTVNSLITGSRDMTDMRSQYFAMVFQIVNTLSMHTNTGDSKPPELRERAGKAIAVICTEDATDQILTALLETKDPEQEMLERFVQHMGEKAATPLIRNLLETASQHRRQMLRSILVSMGASVASELHQWMRKDQWGESIKEIIPILMEIGGSKDPDSLSDRLNHPNPNVRRSAIVDLAVSESSRAAEMIWEKIGDKSEEGFIREFAVSILGEVGNEETAEDVVKLTKGKNPGLRREAIYALGNIGGEKSVSLLSDILRQRRAILGKRLEELQLYAIETLGRMATRPAFEVLQEMSEKKKGSIKLACEKALHSRYQSS